MADAAAITSPSSFVRQLIQARAGLAVEVIPNPFDAASNAAASKRRRVLAVARLVHRKGLQFLIEALAGLGRETECVIAGDGPLRLELEAQARAEGLAVEFTGFIAREALAHHYASASIFVLPSLQENFPMVLLEAMSAGCAVITTDQTGCAEVVGEAGLTVPAGDSAALRRALELLLADPDRVRALGEAARQRVVRFASASVAGQFASLFERCVTPAHGRQPSGELRRSPERA